ncbi:hypothetical protein L1987_20054 [Smallanthus sonchifolius]|uniref:Uncharacterized protein n=1 Tax=Smallanthus sonchifolius TaxID=185202 RepID=A0ACB9IQR5_9ASTR|nr:hypothetical protein L1987_20054 [Smallanthus sonchifolius]
MIAETSSSYDTHSNSEYQTADEFESQSDSGCPNSKSFTRHSDPETLVSDSDDKVENQEPSEDQTPTTPNDNACPVNIDLLEEDLLIEGNDLIVSSCGLVLKDVMASKDVSIDSALQTRKKNPTSSGEFKTADLDRYRTIAKWRIDSHTTMIDGLGVADWGVGGIEAEAMMLGHV